MRRVTRRDVRDLLLEAATRSVAEPRSSFLGGLEAHLGAQVPPGRLIALPRRARRTRVPAVMTGVAAAAAAAVLVGALAGVYGRAAEDRALALAVAVDTTVQLPDGSMITGARGLDLPDGAVVRTGPNGRCSAGDVDLGPGIEALVDSGRLRLRSAATGAAVADPAPGGATETPAFGSVPVTVPLVVPSTTIPTTRGARTPTTVTVPSEHSTPTTAASVGGSRGH
jgi:hypothetical protein